MAFSTTTTLLLTVAVFLVLVSPAHAFGAGNIASMSAIEGVNWRHGDIEDTLLQLVMSRAMGGKKFDKMMIARVYFGNWLRDYSQAIDVGTVKYVSAEAIRILLWVLGFMTFGYGTKEFEVTAERLGCYRPEDHIDNPKDYADNLDATEYDRRLRGRVNERVELAIDSQRGMKNYIASENAGCMTSAEHVRKLFTECIRLGRSFARTGDKAEWYEAMRLLGTGTHCLEDFSAHSNYLELALIEMGERNVFPHVGSRTQMRLPGAQNSVFPLITGTFGGVDFLHSMMGEFDDKATQSEIQSLENTIQQGSQANTSVLKSLLDKIPEGLFGGDQKSRADDLQQASNTAAMENLHVTPKEPEEFTRQMQEMVKQIYPIMEYHDEVMQKITEAIEKIPILPELLEQLENEVNVFVFSLLAPYVLPLIQQIKSELNEGSSEIITSSKDKQHIVFNDDESTDPTHSMLSKDHFSNVLNEPAGKVASGVLKWAVPQLIQAMDDESMDIDRVCSRIINGVFHHPAQRNHGDDGASDCRNQMFTIVEQWWRGNGQRETQDLRRQLSREGVLSGENHKPGQYDTGHGSAGGLKMHNHSEGCGAGEGMIGELLAAMGGGQAAGQAGAGYGRPTHSGSNPGSQQIASGVEQAVGGPFGGILGGIAGAVGGGLLANVLGGGKDSKSEAQSYEQSYSSPGGGQTHQYTEVGHNSSTNTYGQAQYSETKYPDGSRKQEYKKYEQGDDRSGTGAGNYGYEAKVETKPDGYGGYEEKVEKKYRRGDEERTYEEKKYKKKNDSEDDDDDNDDDDEYKKQKKREKKEKKERERKEKYGGGGHSGGRDDNSDDERKNKRNSGGYGGGRQQESSYGSGRQEQSSYGGGRQEQSSYGRQEASYGGHQSQGERYSGGSREEFGRGGHGGGGGQNRTYGHQQEHQQQQSSYGGGRNEYGGGNSGRNEYGGGHQNQMPGGFGGDEGGYGRPPPPREEYGGGGGYGGEQRGGGGYGGGERQEASYGGFQSGGGRGGGNDGGWGNSGGGGPGRGGRDDFGGPGGRDHNTFNAGGAYGRQQQRGDRDEMPGGFGEDDGGYGGGRRSPRREGGGGGYGGGGGGYGQQEERRGW